MSGYHDPSLPVDQRVEDLLSQMTLAEKLGQMTQPEKNSVSADAVAEFCLGSVLSGGGGYPAHNTPAGWLEMITNYQKAALESRLGIPMIYGVDAVHGHNNVHGATIFPHNVGLGASRNPDLVERIAAATAIEVAATGSQWNFAPMVAVPQEIRWGRAFESFGEQTEMVTALSEAYVRGTQQAGRVAACPKHFIGDGGTAWGTSTTRINVQYYLDQGDTAMDEGRLREMFLPPYQAAVDAGALTIMASFSSWNGVKMHAQKYLLTDVLKGVLGFSGFLVSDWQAIDQIPGDYQHAVVTSINAGLDMVMVPFDTVRFLTTITKAVVDGDIPIERIDDAVRRILTVKFRLGLFEHPFADPAGLSVVGCADHRALAREAVRETITLLKCENNALPISKQTPTIFVGGEAGNDIGLQCGGWTIEWAGKAGPITHGTTILEGIRQVASPQTKVMFHPDGKFDESAEVGIAVISEAPYAEGVGDRYDLTIAAADVALIERMRGHCKTLIVLVVAGRPLILTEQLPRIDALVAAWLPGTEGAGVADVLFGDAPFKGKLPYTWPRRNDQLPFDFTTLPAEGEASALFPFGWGLG